MSHPSNSYCCRKFYWYLIDYLNPRNYFDVDRTIEFRVKYLMRCYQIWIEHQPGEDSGSLFTG